MKQFARCSLLALALAGGSQIASAADPLEFHGYFRAGIGLNGTGGGQVCFGLAGADTKYRLGNECDYVIEPTFTARLASPSDKSSWGITVMPKVYRTFAGGSANANTFGDELPVNMGQIYLFGENLPQLMNGRLWGGRRYYDRLQTGINDQFLENEDGDGAGIEDMNVGFGKWSVAWLMNPNNDTKTAIGTSNVNDKMYKLTTRITDIKTVDQGAVQVWLGWYNHSVSDDQTTQPPTVTTKAPSQYRFGVYHTLNGWLNGQNLVGFKIENSDILERWRVVLQQSAFVDSIKTNFDFITEYRSQKTRGDSSQDWTKNDWWTIGARSDTQISGPFRFLVEAGHDQIKVTNPGPATNYGTESLNKITVAGAMSAGPDSGSRPTFRLFYTYAKWNDAAAADKANGVFNHWINANGNGINGNTLYQVYGDSTSGSTFGFQAEAWW